MKPRSDVGGTVDSEDVVKTANLSMDTPLTPADPVVTTVQGITIVGLLTVTAGGCLDNKAVVTAVI